MPYAFDDQRDPLITMHIHGWMTNAEIGLFLGDLGRLVERGTPFAVVLDCTGLRVPEVAHLDRLTGWFASSCARCQRGVAFVVTTPMIRGTLRAVLRGKPMPMPVIVVEDTEAAREWCAQQLALDAAQPGA